MWCDFFYEQSSGISIHTHTHIGPELAVVYLFLATPPFRFKRCKTICIRKKTRGSLFFLNGKRESDCLYRCALKKMRKRKGEQNRRMEWKDNINKEKRANWVLCFHPFVHAAAVANINRLQHMTFCVLIFLFVPSDTVPAPQQPTGTHGGSGIRCVSCIHFFIWIWTWALGIGSFNYVSPVSPSYSLHLIASVVNSVFWCSIVKIRTIIFYAEYRGMQQTRAIPLLRFQVHSFPCLARE